MSLVDFEAPEMTLAASDFTVAIAASEASSIKDSKASMAMDLAKEGDKMA